MTRLGFFGSFILLVLGILILGISLFSANRRQAAGINQLDLKPVDIQIEKETK